MSTTTAFPAADPLKHALALAAQGIPVFPAKRDKKPLTEHGFKDATVDPEAIKAWWTDWPHALPAVPTGPASGLFVLDIDRKPGADGSETLRAKGWPVPATRCHATQSGGAHYLFRYPDDIRLTISAGKLGPGLDTRGAGGYIIWWPAAGLAVPCREDPAELPDWLRAALTDGRRNGAEHPAAQGARIPEGRPQCRADPHRGRHA